MRNFFTAKNLWQQDITFKERTKAGMKTAGMIGITAWLYYRRVWAAIFLILPGIWLYREFLEEESKKKEQEFQKQFREMIQTLSSALNTGYSVENAFYETQKELKIQYPEEARISRELLLITRKLRMHIPVEQVLEEFAERVPSEDVKSFVTVFVTAKKSGGDMIGIIRNTTSQIGDKIEVKREIDTLLAAKKYEFQIMSMVPYGIIAYMSLSFSDFMEELYGNVTGIGVMTLCLGIYVPSMQEKCGQISLWLLPSLPRQSIRNAPRCGKRRSQRIRHLPSVPFYCGWGSLDRNIRMSGNICLPIWRVTEHGDMTAVPMNV